MEKKRACERDNAAARGPAPETRTRAYSIITLRAFAFARVPPMGLAGKQRPLDSRLRKPREDCRTASTGSDFKRPDDYCPCPNLPADV